MCMSRNILQSVLFTCSVHYGCRPGQKFMKFQFKLCQLHSTCFEITTLWQHVANSRQTPDEQSSLFHFACKKHPILAWGPTGLADWNWPKKATMAAELASPLCFVSCRLANWFWQTFQIFSSRTWNPLLKPIFRHFPVNHRHLCWSIRVFLRDRWRYQIGWIFGKFSIQKFILQILGTLNSFYRTRVRSLGMLVH